MAAPLSLIGALSGAAREEAEALWRADVTGTTAWMDLGVCREVPADVMFPEKGQPAAEAVQVCTSCTVRAECLRYALDNDERFGVWGGMSERERRRVKKQGQAVTAA